MQNASNFNQKSESLGIYGKLQVMPVGRGLQQIARRVERFVLQDLARSILREMIERNGKMTYTHQVANCLRARISKQNGVTLFYNVERERANFGNLQRCYSVWNCPICSMTITEGRRIELQQGLSNWTYAGGHAYLVTFTNSHHKGDNLGDLLNGQKKAFIKFWEKRKVKETLKTLGYKGRIVATEVTWGEQNGWHPHYHMIFFFDCKTDLKALQSLLALQWQDACIKSKLKAPDLVHGVDVRDGIYAAKYVSKWGLENEVTKGHLKKGLNGSLTPFDLLRGCNDKPRYKMLFKEFADVFKGKQQLVWSKGLKILLGIEQLTDEQLIDETDKNSVEVRDLAIEVWNLVLRYEKRAHVLELVERDYQNGTKLLDKFIMDLAQLYVGEMLMKSR